VQVGNIVRPRDKGEDMQGRTLDWTVLRARVEYGPYLPHEGSAAEPVVDLYWIGPGPYGRRRTVGYPVAMLMVQL